MAFSAPESLDQAQVRGHQVFEGRLTNWGNIQTGADPNDRSIQSPIFRRPIYGAAIAQSTFVSTANRFWLRYSPQGGDLFNQERAIDLVVTRDRPVLQRIPSPFILFAPTQDYWGDNYEQIDGSLAALGTSPQFRVPQLIFRFFLDPQPAPQISGRDILEDESEIVMTGTGTVDTVRILPIFGRRRVRVWCRTDAVGADVTINGIVGNSSLLTPVQIPWEYSIGSFTLAAESIDDVILPVDPLTKYLVVKAESAAGADTIQCLINAI